MSHFPVLVCLPGDLNLIKLEDALTDVMDPWDENRAVDPYREYEDGSPSEHWWVSSVRRNAEHLRNGTGLDEGDRCSVVYGRPLATVEEKRAEYAEDASWFARLDEVPTWQTVVQLYNEKYHPGTELALVDDRSDSDRLYYEAETGRAYRMSTYNPESKWDYWRIGGRWVDYFIAKEQAPGLVWGERGWDSPKNAPGDGWIHCDGGPLAALDLEAMRAQGEAEAHKRYDVWDGIGANTPPAKPWSHFVGLAELGEITWDLARNLYHDQPRIIATKNTDLDRWSGCVVEEFLPPREEYIAEARRAAVPGYALVTLDREWVAPGRMGWFGMSSDGPGERSGYRHAVNTYLDTLDPATFLVVLDCHI